MATRTKPSTNGKASNGKITANQQQEMFALMRRMITNEGLSRAALAQFMAGNGSAIDTACGYPVEIPVIEYRRLIDREGIANRANSIFSSECWSVKADVYETEAMQANAQTPFEKAWKELVEHKGLYSKLNRFDEVSGIGHYGVMLIGTKNSGPLNAPFPGLDDIGNPVGDIKPHELTYLMPFDETEATIVEWEKNPASPRYGKPLYYTINLANPNIPTLSSGFSERVHWTRCLHVAEGCRSSDVIGQPRLKKVYNYIQNIRKILGGSAEMFWNGGFPGTSFEVPPELVGTAELNKESLKAEIESYVGGFQRYLALSGVQAKQLQPNIADPQPHLMIQMQALSISIEVPMRVFMGTEEARLASMNDSEAWNRRVHRRHDLHVTPNILMPCVDRFINMGIVPKPKEYHVRWPDVYSVSETDRADIAGKMVRALAEYVKSGASVMFPPLQMLTMIMDFTSDEAEEIILAAEEAVRTDEYKYLDDLRKEQNAPKGGAAPAAKPKKKPLGSETPKVKKGGTPVRNEEDEITDNEDDFVVNPLMRCHTGGMPGYKYGQTGKCYTYTEGDDKGRKQARRKAHLQGAAIEISKHVREAKQVKNNEEEPITSETEHEEST